MAGLALLVLLGCLLTGGCWRLYTNTWDEPEHLAAGIELLDRGRYEYDTEHPPLARLFLALGPYLAGAHSYGTPPPDGTREGIDILYGDGHYWRYLTLARLGTLPFLALLLYVTWLWGRRLCGSDGAALLAVLLLVSAPPVLGHAALASLDVAAAATTLLAFYALQSWLTSAELRHAAGFGLTAGIAVATKFSAVPFLGLALPVLALARLPGSAAEHPAPEGRGVRARLAGLALAAVVTLLTLYAVYGPRAPNPAGVAVRFNWAISYLLQRPGLDHQLGVVLQHLWLPREMRDLVNGVVAVKAHNDSGHLSYLLGETRRTGWWYFYLVALAVKTPIPLLLGGVFGLGWLARDGWRSGEPERRAWALAPMLLCLTLLSFVSTFSHINIGIRHILIFYPFLALGAAYTLQQAWRRLPHLPGRRTATAAAVALGGLLTWQLSTLWRAYPDYLPYFNESVAHPARVLVDSDLDWGQDLRRLELRAAQLHIPRLALAYRGTADLTREPLPPLTLLAGHQPVSGWVAVSLLARTRSAGDYAWLDAYRPLERIGKTIDLYYIP